MPRQKHWRGYRKRGTNPSRWKFERKVAKNDVFDSIVNGSLANDKPLALEVGIIYNDGLGIMVS